MNNICVSLETAKKLKQAGRTKEVYFVLVEGGKLGQPLKSEVHPTEVMKKRIVRADSAYSLYSAPTAQEILDDLPRSVDMNGYYYKIQIHCLIDGTYGVVVEYKGTEVTFIGSNLAEALASLRLRSEENI